MLPEAERIVGYIEQHPGEGARALSQNLGVGADQFEAFVAILLRLQEQGEVVRTPQAGWDLPERGPFRVGRVRLERGGANCVVRVAPRSDREEEIFARGEVLRNAFNGDIVLVRLTRRPRGHRLAEGQIVDFVKRTEKVFRCAFHQTGEGGYAHPQMRRESPPPIRVDSSRAAGARDGQTVLVRLLNGHRGAEPQGEVVACLEADGTYEDDLLSVCSEFALPGEHPEATLRAAASLGDIPDGANWPGREDLRDLPCFTIDPVDARDFDDAVSLEELAGGGVRLGVHIADVSHFVRPGTALDREAGERGTSVYLPGHVVPMLPERLSNDLCSLRPNEDRLTKTARLTYDGGGVLRKTEVFHSVIRSDRRFTYEEVLAILERRDMPADHAKYESTLGAMAALRDRLHAKRYERGALALDIPSLRLELDAAKNTVGLGREERDPSHSLIEEFMLEANEAVARYMTAKKLPIVGRVHPPPDEERLEDFRNLLSVLGFRLGGKGGSKALQKLIETVSGDPLSSVIQLGLLRTMGHAEYIPATGLHFALAATAYCHFTSPIRRYPDLLIHQVLDDHLRGNIEREGKKDVAASVQRLRHEWESRLESEAERASSRERRAEEAERQMQRLRLIRYLEPKVGQEMTGRIVSVQPFGFFVRDDETLVEGLVHVATLGDYYEFDPEHLVLIGRRRRRKFVAGDAVRVILAEVDADLREVTFRFVRNV